MDILTPTVVKMKPKYIPVLNSYVVSKVFNDVSDALPEINRVRRKIQKPNSVIEKNVVVVYCYSSLGWRH